jgi:hypothetical protein
MRPATFIGQSHTQCIIEAMIVSGHHVHWGVLADAKGKSMLIEEDGKPRFESSTARQLRQKADESDFCASTIAGNAHNIIGFMALHPPFDFEMPGVDVPLNRNARIIPHRTMRVSLLKVLNQYDFKFVDALFEIVPEIKLHIQSPAPTYDNELCMSLIDPYFRQIHPEAEIADPWIRLKLWKLHSDLFREKFAGKGVGFLEVPPESLDLNGFLLPSYVSESSSTHANIRYGQLVVEQVQRLRQ